MTTLLTTIALTTLPVSLIIIAALATKSEAHSQPGPYRCKMVHVNVLCHSSEQDCTRLPFNGWDCVNLLGGSYTFSGLEDEFFTIHQQEILAGNIVFYASSAVERRGSTRNEIVVAPSALITFEPLPAGGWPGIYANPTNNDEELSSPSSPKKSGKKEKKAKKDTKMGRWLWGDSPRPKRDLACSNGATYDGTPSKLVGTSTVLVVYVTSNDGNHEVDFNTTVDEILGTFGDNVTLASQYAACSNDQLLMEPAENPADGVLGGGVEVSLSQDTAGVARETVETWVDDEICASHTWLRDFDHVMYILPPNTDFRGANAYAQGRTGNKSVYSGASGTFVTVIMHEVGHNLGLPHSGADGVTYGDNSGYMGSPFISRIDNPDRPRMCFNGAKSWFLGWYINGHEELTTNSNWAGQLVGIDDYNNGLFDYAASDRVILKIAHPSDSSRDLYVMYNRAKGVNFGVSELAKANKPDRGMPDRVCIVESPDIINNYSESWRLATLDDATSTFISQDYGYGTSRLVIEVTGMTQAPSGTKDFASITVSYDSSPTAAPTDPCTENEEKFDMVLTTDNYPGDTSWTIVDANEIQVAQNDKTYTARDNTEHRCLHGEEPYTFTIDDSYGDGICCSYGTGSLALFYKDEAVELVGGWNGGNFGSSYSVDLVVSPSSTPSLAPSKSHSPLETPSSAPSGTPSDSPSLGPSISGVPSLVPSSVPSMSSSPSQTPSSAPSGMPSDSPSLGPSISGVPSLVPSSSPSISPSPSETPSSAPSGQPSDPPSLSPSISGVPSLVPSSSPSISQSPSETPSSAPSGQPSDPPSLSPSISGVPSLVPSSSPSISQSPSETPSSAPSGQPSDPPSLSPSISGVPSLVPSSGPSMSQPPTKRNSSSPSRIPTQSPSLTPSISEEPLLVPSSSPSMSHSPSETRWSSPSEMPTESTSSSPSASGVPSLVPSSVPSFSPPPSKKPSSAPSGMPTTTPSRHPSTSGVPSFAPTDNPSMSQPPTRTPSTAPSKIPTASAVPSTTPTETPSMSQPPSETPSASPVTSAPGPTGPTVIFFEDFENGFGHFADGGSDASINTKRVYEGAQSLRIRDDSSSSVATTAAYDVSAYSELEVDFYYYARGMENGKKFALDFNDGSGWQVARVWVMGADMLANFIWYPATVIFTYENGFWNVGETPFTTASNKDSFQFRFRCDANVNNDRIFIDNVTFQGL